ncbi:ChaC-like protein-domain-containing protein [Limtongia smithiae]|uniref:ChaC-like protein-domain-containing protein n=1 Tax=Limtongia smithiae TaxID=1125753 RepID=UPI0034CE043F
MHIHDATVTTASSGLVPSASNSNSSTSTSSGGILLHDPLAEVPSTDFWIFGYGSLIFKPPPFGVERAVPGYISGYVRRFWQLSHDHRGTPEQPGRVVTLVEREYWQSLDGDPHSDVSGEKTFGIAYKIVPDEVPAVSAALDLREQDGYSAHFVPFTASDPSLPQLHCIVYIGTPDNEAFAGVERDIDALAKVIYESEGPSGRNSEYLFKLADALTTLHSQHDDLYEDIHVSELARKVKMLESSGGRPETETPAQLTKF